MPCARPHPDIAVAIAAVLAGSLALPAAGCLGQSCTLIGWDEGLTVALGDGPLADGRYEVAIEVDHGEAVDLSFQVTGDTITCLVPDDCLVERDVGDGRSLKVDVLWDAIQIWYVDDDGLAGGPSVAIVEVSRDGALVASESFRPTYTRSEPNGDGCGVATQARVALPLD